MHGYVWPINCTRTWPGLETLAPFEEAAGSIRAVRFLDAVAGCLVMASPFDHRGLAASGVVDEAAALGRPFGLAIHRTAGSSTLLNGHVDRGELADVGSPRRPPLPCWDVAVIFHFEVWACPSGCTGACTINRPYGCAQQHVGKYQSCMVICGRLIVHAPV